MDLEDSFESDFNAKLEDGSPYEVQSVIHVCQIVCGLASSSTQLAAKYTQIQREGGGRKEILYGGLLPKVLNHDNV